jgi:hypothetical protein
MSLSGKSEITHQLPQRFKSDIGDRAANTSAAAHNIPETWLDITSLDICPVCPANGNSTKCIVLVWATVRSPFVPRCVVFICWSATHSAAHRSVHSTTLMDQIHPASVIVAATRYVDDEVPCRADVSERDRSGSGNVLPIPICG